VLLYKYLSFENAAQVMRSNSIRFSQSLYFNDPFDKPDIPGVKEFTRTDDNEYARFIFKKYKDELNWIELTGILCLTRTATNALMWAHYAQGHTGVVLGIDAVRAGLADEASNLIPAQYGSVVYVSGRSGSSFLSNPKSHLEIGTTHEFPPEHYERLQRLFLQKPLYWAYEEEVRVLKSLASIAPPGGTNKSGSFKLIETGGRQFVHLYQLPSGSIREIYFGNNADLEMAEALYNEVLPKHDFTAFDCKLDSSNFTVATTAYTPLSKRMDEYEAWKAGERD
jgi:hypothetical protein